MFFVGFDYILNELVSDHIALVEPDNLNIVDILEDLHRVDETASPAVGPVDLGRVFHKNKAPFEAGFGPANDDYESSAITT